MLRSCGGRHGRDEPKSGDKRPAISRNSRSHNSPFSGKTTAAMRLPVLLSDPVLRCLSTEAEADGERAPWDNRGMVPCQKLGRHAPPIWLPYSVKDLVKHRITEMEDRPAWLAGCGVLESCQYTSSILCRYPTKELLDCLRVEGVPYVRTLVIGENNTRFRLCEAERGFVHRYPDRLGIVAGLCEEQAGEHHYALTG